RRPGVYKRRRRIGEIPTAPPDLAPTYSEKGIALTVTKEIKEIPGEPRDKIFYWYRLVARLLQGINKVLLGPHQTLREFAKESGRLIGPMAKYFFELTKIIERLLYSQYKPSEKDVENSQYLSNKIEEETKGPITTQSVVPENLSQEAVQYVPEEISVGSDAWIFDIGSIDLTTSPWRQTSTWIRVLLIMAIAYYACILLFILPLFLA
ncbi:DUF4129 domain-containing protein, partial [Chloroflexota bacterium]